MIDAKSFPGRGQVAILRTRPETVLDDYSRLMHLARYEDNLPKDKTTLLKINISWQIWFPGCSTTPWQLEGVIKTLLADGYDPTKLIAAHNNTVVVDAKQGAINNRHKLVTDRYGLHDLHTYEPGVEWVTYEPRAPLLVLDKVYRDGVRIPKVFYGKSVLHLPTMKCVHPSTEIILADGSLVRIGDLIERAVHDNRSTVDEDGDTRAPLRVQVFSLSQRGELYPQTTRYVWRTPLRGRKLWQVRTKTGRQVRVSAEHPFLTPQGWCRAKMLQAGDRVAIPRKIHVDGESQPLPRLQKAYGHTSTRWITIPDKTSPDFWRWFGYFIAEGWVQPMRTTCRFWWTNADAVIQNDFIELTRALFGLDATARSDNPNDHYFDSLQMQEFFEGLGLPLPLDAGNKRVPDILFRCPDSEIAAFLQGYFEGDLGVGQRDGMHAVTKSERLAHQVQYLLTRLGVVAFKHIVWNRASPTSPKLPYHAIDVYADDLVTLSETVKLQLAHKQQRIEALTARRRLGKHPSNWDTIPLAREEFRAVRQGLGFTQDSTGKPSSVNSIENGHVTPTRLVTRYFTDLFRKTDIAKTFDNSIAQMEFLASPDLAWDHIVEIKEVEPDTEYLYDLTIEDDPNFIGNGMVLHNTHVFTTLTGAMKNAFGGLLDEKRHWTHAVIHDTLVDLLQIQQDIHTGIFAVMDGTFAGEGPGPRAMRPYVKNIIMASSDPVAIDAASAKIMGIDPMSVRFIRHAHERGLGVGDPREIKFVGDTDASEENWHFAHDEDTFASWGQKQIYHGRLKPLEHALLRTPLVPWSYAASNIYHNLYWYPFIGHKRAEMMLNTPWGQKFLAYSEGLPFNPGAASKAPFVALSGAAVALVAALGLGAFILTRKD